MDGPEVVEVTRQGLYDQVWSVPVSRACQAYGLSGVGLANICDQWGIPRPPRGYWTKARRGHRVRRPELEPIPEGDPVVLSYRPGPDREPMPGRPRSASDRQRVFENRPENHIAVPDQLADPHPLVARTETSIRGAKPDERGIARPKARGCLDLAVSPAQLDRGLCVLDAAVKALDARGYPVSVGGDHPRTTAAVLGESIGFRLFERSRQRKRESKPAGKRRDGSRLVFRFLVSDDDEWEPEGRLVLQITAGDARRRCWADQGDRRVEQFLNAFVAGVVRAAESIREARTAAERRKSEWEEELRRRREAELRRLEEERSRQEEQARFAELEAQAASWAKAGQIREFVAAVRKAAQDRGGARPGSELERWLAWAEGRAALLDPIPQLLATTAPAPAA